MNSEIGSECPGVSPAFPVTVLSPRLRLPCRMRLCCSRRPLLPVYPLEKLPVWGKQSWAVSSLESRVEGSLGTHRTLAGGRRCWSQREGMLECHCRQSRALARVMGARSPRLPCA
ncbi:Afadin [Manis pentadactyla]|nr:Afadin [Manis pentadactyla]